MKLRVAGSALLVTAILGVASQTASSQQTKSTNLNDISMEIAALQTLRDLDLTQPQLDSLATLARESAPKNQTREPAKASPAIESAFKALHAALVRGDDAQISDCRQKLDDKMQEESPELDDNVVVTDEARHNAAEAVSLLNVRQAAVFLGTLDVADPAELLIAGFEQVRTLKEKELDDEIANVAEEIVWLIDGAEPEESSKTTDRVTALMKKASGFKSDSDFAKQRNSLENEARGIMADVTNVDVLSHSMEKGMAELLSNPRLDSAIKQQKRRPTPSASSGDAPKKGNPFSSRTPK
jgi:hypothetical protein